MKVGVFDSGIGGLSVVKSLLEHQLFEEIVYYGDTARVPYGIKDKNVIIRYGLEAVQFFNNFDIDLLVVACNTVSAFAIPQMKLQANFEIVGVVEPGILAIQNSGADFNSEILILGTRATISSNIYQQKLMEIGYSNIQAIATGLFVPIVEEDIFHGKILDATMEFYFNNLQKHPQYIILGCTHFPLIADEIYKFFYRKNEKKLNLIHSGDAILEYLIEKYPNLKPSKSEIEFFASENPQNLKNIALKWLQN